MSRSIRALVAFACAFSLAGAPAASAYSPLSPSTGNGVFSEASLDETLVEAAGDVSDQAIRDFIISGTGHGHGIGMSQYGAQGFALKGWSYDDILRHYYQGTQVLTLSSIGEKSGNPVMHVNIDKSKSARSSWTMKGYKSELIVSDGSKVVALPANTYQTFAVSNGKVKVDGKEFSSPVDVTAASGSPGLTVVKDASGPPLNSSYPAGYPYMRYRGTVVLQVSGSKLKAVNRLRMDHYLLGVVPRESPASWKPEALKAQAVAARSYAYGRIAASDRADGELDIGNALYCTTSDQVYGAHSRLIGGSDSNISMHEDTRTNAAVNDTAGGIVYHAPSSTIVTTFFFSQSGGRTANIEDVWTSAVPRPYYTSVSDPYEVSAGAPYCPWPSEKEKTLSGLQMADRLRAAGVSGVPTASVYVTGISVDRAASGYPKWVTFRFSDGSSVRVSGWTVRVTFGLLSPMFYFSGFPISRIEGPDRYSTAVQVSKRAFDATAPAVVVASGEDFADALIGSAVAGAVEGALLLTRKSSLPDQTEQELARLSPGKVYVMGSERAVEETVLRAIRNVTGVDPERVQGADRYETAEAAAELVASIEPPSKVFLASGTSWPDAASASAVAYAERYPILLTRQDRLADPARRALESLRPPETILVGGAPVLAEDMEEAVRSATGLAADRIAGRDRYTTSAEVARFGATADGGALARDEVYVATGAAFPDALTGGVLAARQRRVLILSAPDRVKPGTADYLAEQRAYVQKLWILGGVGAIDERGRDALDAAMMN